MLLYFVIVLNVYKISNKAHCKTFFNKNYMTGLDEKLGGGYND